MRPDDDCLHLPTCHAAPVCVCVCVTQGTGRSLVSLTDRSGPLVQNKGGAAHGLQSHGDYSNTAGAGRSQRILAPAETGVGPSGRVGSVGPVSGRPDHQAGSGQSVHWAGPGRSDHRAGSGQSDQCRVSRTTGQGRVSRPSVGSAGPPGRVGSVGPVSGRSDHRAGSGQSDHRAGPGRSDHRAGSSQSVQCRVSRTTGQGRVSRSSCSDGQIDSDSSCGLRYFHRPLV